MVTYHTHPLKAALAERAGPVSLFHQSLVGAWQASQVPPVVGTVVAAPGQRISVLHCEGAAGANYCTRTG